MTASKEEKELKRIKKEYEKFLEEVFRLKMKKLKIIEKYRKMIDEEKIKKIKEDVTNT